MVVLQHFVPMPVFVPFGQVQPNARRHEDCSQHQAQAQCISQEQYREDCPDKRCEREVGSGSRRSEVSKRQDE